MKGIIAIAAILSVLGVGAFLLLRRNYQASLTDNTQLVDTDKSIAGQENLPEGKISIAREITIEASEYKFSPSEIRVKKGETVKITLKNTGKMPHNWVVEKMGGASIDTTDSNKSNIITMTPSQIGTFATFCSIGNHRKLGMVGKLIVE